MISSLKHARLYQENEVVQYKLYCIEILYFKRSMFIFVDTVKPRYSQ